MKIETVILKNVWARKIRLFDAGWGNGYVILPPDHPCFGLEYDEIHKYWDVIVHGGLTFSRTAEDFEHTQKFKGSWAIGFDTCHLGDSLEEWPKERVQEETDRLRFRMLEIWMEKERLKTRKKESEKNRKMSVDTKDAVTVAKKKIRVKRKSVVEPLKIEGGYYTLDNYFKVEAGTYKMLERNIKKGTNTLLLGPTGCGKTELVNNIAKRLELPITIFDMGTMSDPIMSLVGTHIIKVEDGHTSSRFAPSRFSQVIQKPGIILLDEISRSSATANNLLFPCTDFRKELPMEYCFDDCTPVKIHKKCVFVATANVGSQYTGTHKLDRALLDRFMLLEIDPLSIVQVAAVIKSQYPSIDDVRIFRITDCFRQINEAHDNFGISFNLSIRHLKMVAELVVDGFTIYDSFFAICKGIRGRDGLKALEAILGQTKK